MHTDTNIVLYTIYIELEREREKKQIVRGGAHKAFHKNFRLLFIATPLPFHIKTNISSD